jgi:hypothetical protein
MIILSGNSLEARIEILAGTGLFSLPFCPHQQWTTLSRIHRILEVKLTSLLDLVTRL